MNKSTRFAALSQLGCIVCRLHYGVFTQPAIHHLTGLKYRSLGKKAKDEYTIGLCYVHHQNGTKSFPSIHTHPKEFNAMYGDQESLLNVVNEMINCK